MKKVTSKVASDYNYFLPSPILSHSYPRCIQGLLSESLVILVTHQLHYAQEADKLLVLQKGRQQGFGSYSELKDSGLDIGDLLKFLEDESELQPEACCEANTLEENLVGLYLYFL